MKNMENRRAASGMLTLAAGCNQLINWGISFYMPGTFARAIEQDTGWPATQIYLGLTIAMLIMALISPFVARLLARFGGQHCGQRHAGDRRRMFHHGGCTYPLRLAGRLATYRYRNASGAV
jgi:hypothetical protein